MILVGGIVLAVSACLMGVRRHPRMLTLAFVALLVSWTGGLVYMISQLGSPAEHPEMFLAIIVPTFAGLIIGAVLTRKR